MNKAELVSHVAAETSTTRAAAERMDGVVFSAIADDLAATMPISEVRLVPSPASSLLRPCGQVLSGVAHEPWVRNSHDGLLCLSVSNGYAEQHPVPETTIMPSQPPGSPALR